MHHYLYTLVLFVLLPPLAGSLLSGLLRKRLGQRGAHSVTIGCVLISFVAALMMAHAFFWEGAPPTQIILYQWIKSGPFHFDVGCLLDRLSVLMIVFVNFVSLMVHIYSMGYMRNDPGYQRFFSYVSLFTFAMLILVLANNFLLLFFGWEGVGVVSYLLIGFWFSRPSAVAGSLKAFLVNRIGDMGFIVGIACIFSYFGTLDYTAVFAKAPDFANTMITLVPRTNWSLMTVICLLLLFGAMGKSAQMPFHVWLPESMEGPTPISALIHAATMVTAGIYMIARMSPLFELSTMALSAVLVIGATTCLLTGLLGIFQYDIKRVIAYSTLSQLGYMVAACGASAFSAAVFHLFTHACFKALLFLAAGSVILAMHHEQDMRQMGGLKKTMPITYATFLIGSLALTAIPPFSGFFSKESIIDAVGLSTIPGAKYAYFCVVIGTFVTALYTFRALFLTFHTRERMGEDIRHHLHESPWTITLPLICLAVPSAVLGIIMVKPMLYDASSLLGSAIFVLPQHNVIAHMQSHFGGVWGLFTKSMMHYPLWLTIAGIVVAWLFHVRFPSWSAAGIRNFPLLHKIMLKKYGFDDFNQLVFVRGTLMIARTLFKQGDTRILDGYLVNGLGRFINVCSLVARRLQTGYLYHYAFAMVVGLFGFLGWCLLGL